MLKLSTGNYVHIPIPEILNNGKMYDAGSDGVPFPLPHPIESITKGKNKIFKVNSGR